MFQVEQRFERQMINFGEKDRRCCINHPEAELPQTSDGFTQQRPSGVRPER